MRLNELNQVTKVQANDLVLIYASANSQARTAPFSLMTEAARDAVYEMLGMPGAKEDLGFAAAGVNNDITRLTAITTSAILTDANSASYIGTFGTTNAASNTPEASIIALWSMQLDTNNRAQLGISLANNKLYWRKMSIVTGDTGTWSAWNSATSGTDFTVANIGGAGATGRALMATTTPALARTALGFTALGSNLVLSTDTATARSNLGAGAVGGNVFVAATTAAALTALGAGTQGAAMFAAADSAAALAALGSPTTANGYVLGNSAVAGGPVLALRLSTNAADANSVARRDGNGALFTGTPTQDAHAATKAYVDAVKPAQLATARNIALTGGAAGNGDFDGSANLSITVTLATPTGAQRGGVLQQSAQADLAAAPTMGDFNALLAKLRSAGVLAAS